MKDLIRKSRLIIILILFVSLFITNCKGKREWVAGVYLCWNWTPDGRIIYAKRATYMSKSKGGLFEFDWGYQTEGFETYICIIDKDGKNNQVLKRIRYDSHSIKVDKVAQEIIKKNEDRLKKKYGGKNWKWMAVTAKEIIPLGEANEIATGEIAAGLHPDPPLAHISTIDWNAKNNLIVVGENKDPRSGIPINPIYIVDPQFNIVKYLETGINPAWSPDGKKIAYKTVERCGDIWIIDEEGENKHKVTSGVYSFNWTPDRNIVVNANPSGIIDLKGNYVRKFGDVDMGNPHFSPDGKWIVYYPGIISSDGMVNKEGGGTGHRAKWSSDGKHIIGGWEGGIRIVDVRLEDGKVWNLRYVTPGVKQDSQEVEYYKTPR